MMLAFYDHIPFGARQAKRYSNQWRYDDRVEFYLNAVHHSLDYFSEYYDPEKCVSLGWFVRNFTKSILYRYMRYLRAKARYCPTTETPVDDLPAELPANITEEYEENAQLRDQIYWLMHHARPACKDIVLLHISGKNFSQIAELTGLTSSGVQTQWNSFQNFAKTELKINPAPKDFRLKFNLEKAFSGTGKSYWKECEWCGKKEVRSSHLLLCPNCQRFFDHDLTPLERRLLKRLREMNAYRKTDNL